MVIGKDIRIDILGAGALGSRIIFDLAREGYTNIHVWDADVVEEKNCYNQQHTHSSIDDTKIQSIKDQLEPFNAPIWGHEEMWDGQDLGSIVICAVDSMAVRMQALQYAADNMGRLFIEGRMARNRFDMFVIEPLNLEAVQQWMDDWYEDGEATSDRCSHFAETASMSAMLGGMVTRTLQDYLSGGRFNTNSQFIYQPGIGMGVRKRKLV